MEKDFATKYGDLDKWHWWFRGRRKVLEAVLNREFGNGRVEQMPDQKVSDHQAGKPVVHTGGQFSLMVRSWN